MVFNYRVLQKFQTLRKFKLQSKALRHILNAPPYISNETIHNDLRTPTVKQTAIARYENFYKRLSTTQSLRRL